MVTLIIILAVLLVFIVPIVIFVYHINKTMNDIMDAEEKEEIFCEYRKTININ